MNSFLGLFVMNHYTAQPDQSTKLLSPKSVASRFELELLWTQPTFSTPIQIWKATSAYSVQDYSGIYKLQLMACVADFAQVYNPDTEEQKCAVTIVLEFPLQVAFQQSNRPVPAIYSLSTQFQLTNSKRMFLLDPNTNDVASLSESFHGKSVHVIFMFQFGWTFSHLPCLIFSLCKAWNSLAQILL